MQTQILDPSELDYEAIYDQTIDRLVKSGRRFSQGWKDLDVEEKKKHRIQLIERAKKVTAKDYRIPPEKLAEIEARNQGARARVEKLLEAPAPGNDPFGVSFGTLTTAQIVDLGFDTAEVLSEAISLGGEILTGVNALKSIPDLPKKNALNYAGTWLRPPYSEIIDSGDPIKYMKTTLVLIGKRMKAGDFDAAADMAGKFMDACDAVWDKVEEFFDLLLAEWSWGDFLWFVAELLFEIGCAIATGFVAFILNILSVFKSAWDFRGTCTEYVNTLTQYGII